jgi:hypothetical protein
MKQLKQNTHTQRALKETIPGRANYLLVVQHLHTYTQEIYNDEPI